MSSAVEKKEVDRKDRACRKAIVKGAYNEKQLEKYDKNNNYSDSEYSDNDNNQATDEDNDDENNNSNSADNNNGSSSNRRTSKGSNHRPRSNSNSNSMGSVSRMHKHHTGPSIDLNHADPVLGRILTSCCDVGYGNWSGIRYNRDIETTSTILLYKGSSSGTCTCTSASRWPTDSP